MLRRLPAILAHDWRRVRGHSEQPFPGPARLRRLFQTRQRARPLAACARKPVRPKPVGSSTGNPIPTLGGPIVCFFRIHSAGERCGATVFSNKSLWGGEFSDIGQPLIGRSGATMTPGHIDELFR